MCSRTVLGELKNVHSQKIPFRLRRRFEQRFCKACHIIFFAVAMLVLLNAPFSYLSTFLREMVARDIAT